MDTENHECEFPRRVGLLAHEIMMPPTPEARRAALETIIHEGAHPVSVCASIAASVESWLAAQAQAKDEERVRAENDLREGYGRRMKEQAEEIARLKDRETKRHDAQIEGIRAWRAEVETQAEEIARLKEQLAEDHRLVACENEMADLVTAAVNRGLKLEAERDRLADQVETLREALRKVKEIGQPRSAPIALWGTVRCGCYDDVCAALAAPVAQRGLGEKA